MGGGLVARNQPSNWRVGPCKTSPDLSWILNSITNSEWFNHPRLCLRLHKDPKDGSESFQVGECVEVLGVRGGGGTPGEGAEALHTLPISCPVYLFHVTVLEVFPFTWNGNLESKHWTMNWSGKSIKPKERVLKPSIYIHLFRSTGENLDLWLAFEVEGRDQSCGTEPLPWGLWCFL